MSTKAPFVSKPNTYRQAGPEPLDEKAKRLYLERPTTNTVPDGDLYLYDLDESLRYEGMIVAVSDARTAQEQADNVTPYAKSFQLKGGLTNEFWSGIGGGGSFAETTGLPSDNPALRISLAVPYIIHLSELDSTHEINLKGAYDLLEVSLPPEQSAGSYLIEISTWSGSAYTAWQSQGIAQLKNTLNSYSDETLFKLRFTSTEVSQIALYMGRKLVNI